ncbi:galactokinase [Luteitalea sp.]|uniref:galactokinase n=1 Tax=Luteitalea sp. TaxID=2004800 RepID=UPI0037C69D84
MTEIPRHDIIRHLGHRRTIIGEAPGRVNLIGEHTDYSGGFVLPTVIPQTTAVAVAANADVASRAWSASVPHDEQRARFVVGEEQRRGAWVDYVQGASAVLRAAGHPVGGFDAVIRSEVPLGSGLSSSAALSVSVLRALRELFQLRIDDVVLAGLARRVETDFIGVPVGVMDPIACALGAINHALFLDTRDLSWQLVRIPSTAEIAVVNSGIRHSISSGHYRIRRQELEAGIRALGVHEPREITDVEMRRLESLPALLQKRVRHVITENARVLEAVEALRKRDIVRFGQLMNASHQSLRDDYEVSVPEIDRMVEIARAQRGVLGARITGGGFGGSIVLLTTAGNAARAAEAVAKASRDELRLTPQVLIPPAK